MFGIFKKKKKGKPAGWRRHDEGLMHEGDENSRIFQKSLIFLLTTTAVFLFVFIFIRTVSIFLLLFAGILFAVMVTSFGEILEKKTGLSHRPAVTIVLILLTVLVGVVVWYTAPNVAGEIQSLSGKLSESVRNLGDWLEDRPGGSFLNEGISSLENLLFTSEAWSSIGGVFSSTLGVLSALFLILWVGVYLSYDPRTYVSGSVRLVPPAHRKRATEVLRRMGSTLRWWLVAQLISMVFLAVTTWIALAALGVPLAFALALLTGIFTFIPYLGPILALVPIVLLAFLKSPATALWTFLIFQGIQVLEGNILLPLVYQKTVRIPPVVTILSQLLFGTLFGLPGVLLATPLAAIGMVGVRMLYLEDILGETICPPGRFRMKSTPFPRFTSPRSD